MEALRDKKGLTEEEFLRQYDPDKHPKPAVTADIAVFRENGGPEVLLIRRGGHPFLGRWALPGGFAEKGERMEQSAARELWEETGVTGAALRLVGVYSAPGRDPRGWTVSAAYAARLPEGMTAAASDDAADARWFRLAPDENGTYTLSADARKELGGPLAFDHEEILADAVKMML